MCALRVALACALSFLSSSNSRSSLLRTPQKTPPTHQEDEKKEEEEDQPGETAPPTTAAAAERSLPTAQSARVRQQSLPPVPDGKDAVAAAPGTTVCTVPEALPPGSVVVTTDAEGTDGESNSEDGVRHKDTGSCESVGERFHETRRSKEVAVQTEAMLKAGGDGEDENNAIVQYHGPPRAMPSIRVIQRFEARVLCAYAFVALSLSIVFVIPASFDDVSLPYRRVCGVDLTV